MEVENTAQTIDIPADTEFFGVLEACLFAAGHPLTYEKLAEVLQVTPNRCRSIVEAWKKIYNDTSAYPRGILLLTFPDSCQLCTREKYAAEIKTALGIRRGGKLSQSLLEVLAVIAYNQPTTRAFIDTVRGVDSSYAVSALLEKQLIEPCGKLDAPGRPTLYRTTADFLRVFGINSLMELPAVQVRSENGEKIDIAPDISLLETDRETADTIVHIEDTAEYSETGSPNDTEAIKKETSVSSEDGTNSSFSLPED